MSPTPLLLHGRLGIVNALTGSVWRFYDFLLGTYKVEARPADGPRTRRPPLWDCGASHGARNPQGVECPPRSLRRKPLGTLCTLRRAAMPRFVGLLISLGPDRRIQTVLGVKLVGSERESFPYRLYFTRVRYLRYRIYLLDFSNTRRDAGSQDLSHVGRNILGLIASSDTCTRYLPTTYDEIIEPIALIRWKRRGSGIGPLNYSPPTRRIAAAA
ncbi:hypothetical protein OF83DRAFT_1080630 [Amylostereum chailletii]|nr:hypothetical protein OF83DRAFT_1080630 [Amylostereum chailletii]